MTPEPENQKSEESKDTSPEEVKAAEHSPDIPDEPVDEEEAALEKEFAELLDQHLPEDVNSSRGELLELQVVAVRDDSVLVDMGGKAEASISLDEFPLINGERKVSVGDTIPVVQVGRNQDGSPRVSHRQARARQARKNVKDAADNKVPIRGTVTRVVKGGLMVDVGLEAFMPASQVDLFKIPDLSQLIGDEIEAYVLEFDPRRSRAVLSRRQLLYERRESEKKDFLKDMNPGEIVTGKVKSCLDFGVFVELGLVDGFVPREELSWDRGKAPTEVLKVGDEIELKLMNVSPDSGKITLSRKRLSDNPWENIDDRFPVGSTVTGEVVAIQGYGAFVHVEEGITGMIHASDMSWATGNKKPEDYVRVGDKVTSQVVEIDRKKKRLSLGLKQLTRDPWGDVEERFAPKTKHKGEVTSLTNYGAFVKLDDYIEGMVHVSDMSWEKRINHPKEVLDVGDEVEVIVLKTDRNQRRISLGIKQLKDSPFDAFMKDHKVNSVVEGKVTRFAPFGVFVEVAEGVEGLVHISHIDDKRVELPEHVLKNDEVIKVKILSYDRKKQKISLSRKEAIKQAEKESIKSYMKKTSDTHGGMTFGEALKEAQRQQDDND